MKKFTKILSRRLAKDHDGNHSKHAHKRPTTSSTLYEAPCFHQLSSSRLIYGSGRQPTRGPPPSSSRLDADQSPELTCATCAGINFPTLLDWRPGRPRPWINLSHVLEHEGEPGCPYCAFFRAMLGGDAAAAAAAAPEAGQETAKFAPYLRIRLAFERLGVREKHVLGGAVLIEVMARNKSLPWGYVVKAADEEGASVDGYLGSEGDEVGIRGRTVTPILDPGLVKTWVRFCEEHHQETLQCGGTRSLPEGLRLIDVKDWRLVSVEDLGTEQPEYITLSYADAEGHKPEQEDDSLPEDTPPLITDAIELTKALGYQYLWIDRYCHLTLPSDTRRRQLDLMNDIFAQSSLTLVVAAGGGGLGDGIPGVSVPRDPQLSLKTETGLFVTSLLRPDLEVASSAWASEARSYQEGRLSRRRLVLTPSQAYFQCGTLHCHESLSTPLGLSAEVGLNLGRVFPETGAGTRPEHLKNHIRAYMGKQHGARPEDRLDAFRGILAHYKTRKDLAVDNFLGLPLFHPDAFSTERVVSQTDRLAAALGWLPTCTTLPPQKAASSSPLLLLDRDRCFPSWTWLPWRPPPGQATNNPSHHHHHHHHAFHLGLMDSSHPGGGGVCAPPKMEISVGFGDDVLSWEIDGDAIGRRREEVIRFLRVRSYVFTLRVRREGGIVSLAGDADLGPAPHGAIIAWFRAAAGMDEAGEGSVPDGEYELTGVLVSGRNWRAPGGEKDVTVLICRRDPWRSSDISTTQTKNANAEENTDKKKEDEEAKGQKQEAGRQDPGKLVRLGALTLSYNDFTVVDDDETAVMEGVDLGSGGGGGERGDVHVALREIDIY
ncbi:hypothetical protein ACRE_015590 [Hapsidospora chrysogenum ATCC 11550]|uniref:Heterokaryon incompatibility domain-containing protein n=1 Tax=Hapsidospora chrysogenum (strain ATCC 11550 / CBS 779.69 / DSM 880 / IAM 14645 / JCM 23072 / IMI 49137) TaxID=857340 RepID=A0A086TE08_HAPC1|nr:hypothetical protein ACRE_015590 [Hapsidospora chrysogenum ATCC 11550]